MSPSVSVDDTGWFVSRTDADAHIPRIYCFAHAGGDSRSFLAWQDELGDEAELVAVCPPGRAHRAREPRPTLAEFAQGAAAAIAVGGSGTEHGPPVYLFGHSLGSLVAFETARRLRELPALRRLFVSGVSAPSLAPSQRVCDLAALEGREFAEALRFFEGLPPEVLAHEDLLDLLLPGVIADFRMAAGYRYRPAPPLTVGVTLIAGRDDAYLDADKLALWDRECVTSPACHWVDGGHFHFRDKGPSAVIDLLLAAVRTDQHIEVI
ncbi:thioesterase II family protein [Embleya scabrispora]|uniref:thioesterase II family protein n=1 Tax=Embleya scabrispora TaxID=159449 RepID=UPI0003A542AE|nr:alpha/beta fold hydrolase [Embleya scabrispora]